MPLEFVEEYRYFLWLCDQIEDCELSDEEEDLLSALYATPFKVVMEMDEDREADGLALRDEYTDRDILPEMPCTVLEVLVALARRMAFELSSSTDEIEEPERYFWEMVWNLGLNLHNQEDWEAIIEDWLARDFRPSGAGSPFPLSSPTRDQRYVDLRYQMSAYLNENYPV